MKVARPVRRGTDGKVPLGNSPAVYPTLIIASAAMGQIRRRHTGDALREVIEGTYEIMDPLPAIARQVDYFQEIDLKPAEQQVFAEAALSLRWETDQAPVTPSQLLHARRPEDDNPTLWTTYQRVQENLLKGDKKAPAVPDGGRPPAPSSRSMAM